MNEEKKMSDGNGSIELVENVLMKRSDKQTTEKAATVAADVMNQRNQVKEMVITSDGKIIEPWWSEGGSGRDNGTRP